MIIPSELQKNPPRDINYSSDLFKNNRKKVKAILVGSALIIPVFTIIFYLKFGADDIVTGVLIGFGIAGFFELIGLALYFNAKKAANLCQNGVVVIGNVQKSSISGNTGKYTTKDSAGYIFITVVFKEKLGRELKGMVTFIGAKKEIDLKEGDQVPVLYPDENPQTFILYSDTLGISTIGKAKFTS